MGRIGGLELAPLNVPFRRRLQTLAALFTSYMFFFGGLTAIFVLVFMLHTKYYWITLLYLTWLYYDRNTSRRGGRRINWLRQSPHCYYLRDFFPLSLVKTADLDDKENYIIGYHPHGVMGYGTTNFCTDATGFKDKFPGIVPYVMTLKLLHWLPVYREWITACGYVDVSKQSIDYIFRKKGQAVVILIGGAKESLDANPHKTTLVLRGRMGFVKMALKHGAHLVPCFSFGENELYRHVFDNKPGSRIRRIQRFFQKRFGYAPIFVTGRGVFNYTVGFVPIRNPVTTVVGRPIIVEKDENPSADKINSLHARYMDELKALFDENKANYDGYAEQTMEFVE